MTFEILVPALSEGARDITDAHLAAVGLGRVMSNETMLSKMVANVKRSIGLT